MPGPLSNDSSLAHAYRETVSTEQQKFCSQGPSEAPLDANKPSLPARWPASLELCLSGRPSVGGDGKTVLHKTVLHKKRHKGPLYIQKLFYPEGESCAHIYLLHPPGGIVSGDTLEISLSLEDKAQALLTTPGATRLYNARIDGADTQPLPQRVINRISALRASCVEWLPAETIVFDGACVELNTQVDLHEDSQFMGWEIVCMGLPASQASYSRGHFRQTFLIRVDDEIKVADTIKFEANSAYLLSACGLRGYSVFASFIAGPVEDSKNVVEVIRDVIDKAGLSDFFSATALNGFAITRYLGRCSDEARQLFIAIWKAIRPLLTQRDAVEPRIWAT